MGSWVKGSCLCRVFCHQRCESLFWSRWTKAAKRRCLMVMNLEGRLDCAVTLLCFGKPACSLGSAWCAPGPTSSQPGLHSCALDVSAMAQELLSPLPHPTLQQGQTVTAAGTPTCHQPGAMEAQRFIKNSIGNWVAPNYFLTRLSQVLLSSFITKLSSSEHQVILRVLLHGSLWHGGN